MNQSLFQYPYQNLPYECLIENHIDHLLSAYAHLSTNDATPQFWSVSTTHVAFEKKHKSRPILPQRCLALLEQLYVHILPRLISNFERANKRCLQPLTYVYVDDPSSKKQKPYARLPSIDKCCANGFRSSLEHPETTPHCHAVMLVSPSLRERFEEIAPNLEQLFKSLNVANRTLHAVPFEPEDIRREMFYGSKFHRSPPVHARHTDLYTVLPKSISDPIYVKPRWEREHKVEVIKRPTFGLIEAGTLFGPDRARKP